MNDCDFKKATEKHIDERVPFMDFALNGMDIDYINIAVTERPRLLKTHLPLCFLPDNLADNCKIVYVIRNPRDAEVSFFHFTNGIAFNNYKGDFSDHIQLFIKGTGSYGPWWKHVDGFVSNPNVHFLYYEQLHQQPFETIKSLSQYLGKNLSDDQINSIIKWTLFDNMKDNTSVNYNWYNDIGFLKKDVKFYRKGKIGDWINHFTKDQLIEFDKAIKNNLKTKHEFNYGYTEDEIDKFYSNKT